jgi:serine protease Do
MRRLMVCALCALFARETTAEQPHGKYWTERDGRPVSSASDGVPDFAAIARFARPSVVSITSIGMDTTPSSDSDHPNPREYFDRFYGGADPPTKGMASGFIIRSDGYILTNEHVVEEAGGLAVTLGGEEDGRTYPAVVVGRDDLSDLALIKINAGKELTALPLGNSDALSVGDWVTAIGNPFGLNGSLSVGVVSYIGRRDISPSGRPGYYDFIQTDAAINPGNSGGPLVDRYGRVVGLNAAVNATGQGIGFAIPINMAKDVLPALFESGSLHRSFLGVSIQDLSPDLAASFGVERGVVVTEVSPNGPASRAGVAVGDIIRSFDGNPIERAWRLRWLASGAGSGRHVTLDLLHEGKPRSVEVALAPLPGAAKFHRPPPMEPRDDLQPLGFAVNGMVAVSTGRGLRVSEVDPLSRAYVAGLREGDVILEVGDKTVSGPTDLPAKANRALLRLLIQRGVRPLYVAFHCGSRP